MKEIEYRAKRAQLCRQYLDIWIVRYQWEWCIHVGLWETSGCTDNNNGDKMFRWTEPGQRK